MCGIFGYVSQKVTGEEALLAMGGQQIHRGPDDAGHYVEGFFGLGIRRLSVIDLETGHQPIFNEDKTVAVVCNGEIYNYQELTAELKAKGHHFYTHSDVESLVHLYEEFGPDFLSHLNGMFGLALYDSRKRCLFVARDRLGIKPLYYSASQDTFLFSSELRSLLATGLVSRELDWNGISDFLDHMYISTPRSPFRDITKVKAGHYLKIDEQARIQDIQYWRLEDTPSSESPKTEEEASEKLTSLLKDSARLQLNADVPVCAFLSGGIDSSAVVAFSAMAASRPLRTYHVYFGNAAGKMDERRYAKAVAERYGTIHAEVAVDEKDFSRLIPKLIWHLEEPFGDLASIPTYIISQMARQEATVCLNGSGGDELFAGYPHHKRIALNQLFFSGLDAVGAGRFVRELTGRQRFSYQCPDIFPLYINPAARSRSKPNDVFPEDRINEILARDIDGYLQSNVLFLLDKIAMAVSLEGRVPLLDHRFVETAAHLPSSLKIRKSERKYIFKKMLEPFLPKEVLYRKKEGFGAPLRNWLTPEIRASICRVIENGSLRKSGLAKFDEVRIRDLGNWDLWKICCLELWYRIIAESSSGPTALTLEDFT